MRIGIIGNDGYTVWKSVDILRAIPTKFTATRAYLY